MKIWRKRMNQLFNVCVTEVFVEQLGYTGSINKLDGVGPVDNRPSTDKLHHFVCKKIKK